MMVPAPYLDLNGFTARTVMPSSDVAIVVTSEPGFFARKEAQVRATINARLRKRYAVPFGTKAPELFADGTNPPPAVLSGSPRLGSIELVLAIVAAGALGTAQFQWSQDGGDTWTFASALASSGTTPPSVTIAGSSALSSPGSLVVQVTAGGTLGTAKYQWSQDGGATKTIGIVLAATGTMPPTVTVSGASSLALPSDLQIQITTGGALMTAVFRWSRDGGSTWSSGVTASSVPLPGTGLTVAFPPGIYATDNVYVGQGITTSASASLATTGLTASFPPGIYATDNVYVGQGITTSASASLATTGLTASFSTGTYATDNVYSAPTPVPEAVLAWITTILTPDMYRKRGADPTDPQLALVEADRTQAFADIKEAADSETGLFDLPLVDTASDPSAVSRGGPLFYTETSPFVSADMQEQIGRQEDGWYR